MAQLSRKLEINIASVPVRGFGGMCMVIASIVCAAAVPATRWFMLAAIVAGIAFGVAMIWMRGGGDAARPTRGGRPLFGERPSVPRELRRAPTSLGHLRAAKV